MKYTKFASLVALSLVLSSFSPVKAKRTPPPKPPLKPVEPPCDISVVTDRLTLRHIEARGIGYKKGYSTLEGFFTPTSLVNASVIPFLDVRGHIFNDGKLATNIGIGLRSLSKRVFGINAYYDYRQTSRRNYNQIAAGLESLGEVWDFRINGYLPVGKTKSRFFHTKFDAFKGNHLIISRKREFAMKGVNAEVGGHFKGGSLVDFYAAAGPYYFINEGKQAIGGEGRILATVWDHFGFQLSGSYDSEFKGIVQGEFSFIIPLGGKRHVTKRKEMSCPVDQALRERAYQKIDRQEIIVVDRKRRRSTAINPATGKPWEIYFVDNTSHSQGTFESPFNTLSDAEAAASPNDVIYVFPGDGTDNGQDTGIVLQDGQRLLGAGHEQLFVTTKGTVVASSQAKSMPLISNTNGLNVVELANNNEVSGFLIRADVGNEGINAFGTGMNTIITNNQIFGMLGTGIGVLIQSTPTLGTVTIARCSFLGGDGTTPSTGIIIDDCSNGTVNILNNFFSGDAPNHGLTQAIAQFALTTSGSVRINCINNVVTQNNNVNTNGPMMLFLNGATNTTAIYRLIGNSVNVPNTTTHKGIRFTNSSQMCVTMENNDVVVPSGVEGYYIDNSTAFELFQLNFDPSNRGNIYIPTLPVTNSEGCD